MALPLPSVAPNTLLSFLGIREKDLPYGGKPDSHSAHGVSSNPLPLKGHSDDDTSHLLSCLTGITHVDDCVTNASTKKTKWKRAHRPHGRGPGFAERAMDLSSGFCTHEGGAQHNVEQTLAPGIVHDGPPCFEKALDTTDLSFWMYTVVPNGESNLEEGSFSDADSEELERRVANEEVSERGAANDHEQVDDHAKREEFRARIKESLSFVRMRMEMLQDLSLGEASKEESAGAGDTAFMSSTSILLKHARRQAGILHTEEQAIRLQDLYQWFQNIGKTLGDDALGASTKSALHSQLECLRNLNVVKDLYEATQESKLAPSASPFELLRHVEQMVRDRLANLYQGKVIFLPSFVAFNDAYRDPQKHFSFYSLQNFILSHQADIWANVKSGSPESGNKGETLHATMERLQKMENAYEMLGTTILENLKEVERMEDDFHVLQSELVTIGCPLLTISHKKAKNKKPSHKGKKKGTSSESDSMNTGSSRSESSSAQSTSRPTNAQAEDLRSGKEVSVVLEQPSNNKRQSSKGVDEKNMQGGGKSESNSSLKLKKKSLSQKNENKKGATLERTDDIATQENDKRQSPTSAEVSTYPQASSPSVTSPVTEATLLDVVAKEERGQVIMSASSGIGLNNNRALGEGSVSGAPTVIEEVHAQEAKPLGSDVEGQVVNERLGRTELPRFSKESVDFLGAQNMLTLPKTSLTAQDGRDIRPSDSASLQILPKPKRKSHRMSSEVSKDDSVQTDDVAILSLEDCDVDTLRLCDYQAADVKGLLENMKKMQKQLQFWRTKNWAEKHAGQGQMVLPPVYNQFLKVDASPDMGMLCYYNPRTGVHTMKNVTDLDTITQQSIMNLVAGANHVL